MRSTSDGHAMAGLLAVVQELSLARDPATVQDIVRHAARNLTGADGATVVFRSGTECYYADEDAIEPLWKGQRFPLDTCISGWVIQHRRAAVIEDIDADDRIPHDLYRSTFVKSLIMVPIRSADPLGAIGNYWAEPHAADPGEVQLLQGLADSTAIAMEHVRVLVDLERRVTERTSELAARTAQAESLASRLAVEVDERRRAEELVRELSVTDELTGVSNRRGFVLRAGQARAMAKRRRQPSLVLFVDLDGLKAVNDLFGHERGDAVIREAAGALQAVLRASDVLGRWGGDEFVAFLPATTDADQVRHRLIARLDASTSSLLALSIGIIEVAATDARSLEDLVSCADAAMYADKRRRR